MNKTYYFSFTCERNVSGHVSAKNEEEAKQLIEKGKYLAEDIDEQSDSDPTDIYVELVAVA